MDDARWLEARREGIGSSDAAPACGITTFGRGPLDVWLDKTGGLPPRKENREMKWGLLLEDVVAAAYEELTGRRVVHPKARLFHHDSLAWMLASPDRLTAEQDRIVELKTARTAEGWGEPWTDEVPEAYLIQVQHQMAVMDCGLAEICVLIAGSEPRVYVIPRRQDIIDAMIRKEADLWSLVLRGEPPPVNWDDEHAAELVEMLRWPTPGTSTDLAGVCVQWADAHSILGQEMAAYGAARDQLRARLVEAMGEAEVGVLPDGRRVRRRLVPGCHVSYERDDYFDFRILKPARQKARLK